jgi:hypothetical protein
LSDSPPNTLKNQGASTIGSAVAVIHSIADKMIKTVMAFFFKSTFLSIVAFRMGNAIKGPIEPARRREMIFQAFAYTRKPPTLGSKRKLMVHRRKPPSITVGSGNASLNFACRTSGGP